MSGITLLEVADSTIPTPATDKATIFLDSADGQPKYKDDTGTVNSLAGPAGQGVPAGGTAGQVLTKDSGTDYDTSWQDPSGANRNVVSALTSTAGVVNIDWSLGDYFTHALDENVTSIAFSNLPASPAGTTLMIRFTQDTTPRTVAWPASFRWAGGTDGVISTGSGSVDVLAITSFDQGTTWIATLNNAFAA